MAASGGNDTVVADRTYIGSWEVFAMLDLGGGNVAFQVYDGHYLTVDSGSGALSATASSIGTDETFEIYYH